MRVKPTLVISLSFIAMLVLLDQGARRFLVPFSLADFLPHGHPERLAYESFEHDFGSEGKITLLVENPNLNSQPQLLYELDLALYNQLVFIKGIEKVSSLSQLEYIVRTPQKIELRSFFHNKLLTEEAKSQLQKPLWKNRVLSKTGEGFFVRFEVSKDFFTNYQSVVDEFLGALKDIEQTYPGTKIMPLGPKVLQYYMAKEQLYQQNVVTPVLSFLLCFFFWLQFRSLLATWIAFCVIWITSAFVFLLILILEGGIGPYSGFSLNFVLVVTTSVLMHYFCSYRKHRDFSLVWHEIRIPCFLASLTTSIAFATLLFASALPVRYFGVYCSVGALLGFAVTFILVPFMIKSMNPTMHLKEGLPLAEYSKKLVASSWSKPKAVVAVFVLLALAGGLSIPHLKLSYNPYDKFVEDHPLTASIRGFKRHSVGLEHFDIRLTPKNGKLFDAENLDALHWVTQKLASLNEASQIFSLSDVIDAQVSDFYFSKYLLSLLGRYGVLDGLVDSQFKSTRLQVGLNALDYNQSIALSDKITEILKGTNQQFDFIVTGYDKVKLSTYQSIQREFYQSFFLNAFFIFLLFLLYFKSMRGGLIAMIPNLFPIFVLVGLMVLMGIPPDDHLIILIAVVLGISVDDTIHFLTAVYRNAKSSSSISLLHIQKSYDETSPALITTTMLFVFCLPCLSLSHVVLFKEIAWLLAAAMFSALIADLVLLPCLLVNDKLKKSPQKHV